jgi:hypothetical protein
MLDGCQPIQASETVAILGLGRNDQRLETARRSLRDS